MNLRKRHFRGVFILGGRLEHELEGLKGLVFRLGAGFRDLERPMAPSTPQARRCSFTHRGHIGVRRPHGAAFFQEPDSADPPHGDPKVVVAKRTDRSVRESCDRGTSAIANSGFRRSKVNISL